MSEFKVQNLFDLETLEFNIFRGVSQKSTRSVFGGQVIGQALLAASKTIEEDRPAHSLHAYFLRPGDANAPIIYHIERIRSGRSFSTRRIVAVQHGEAIFNMDASFHAQEEAAVEYQQTMPDVPPPEELQNELDLRKEVAEKLPESWHEMFLRPRPIELRPVEKWDLFDPKPTDPVRHQWMRANIPMNDDPKIHQALLAYSSDMSLMGTAMLPHGETFMQKGYMGASLDHAMWFHRPFRMDEWLLYVNDSPVAYGARGYNRGAFYSRDGVLVASAMQEGLIRHTKFRKAQ